MKNFLAVLLSFLMGLFTWFLAYLSPHFNYGDQALSILVFIVGAAISGFVTTFILRADPILTTFSFLLPALGWVLLCFYSVVTEGLEIETVFLSSAYAIAGGVICFYSSRLSLKVKSHGIGKAKNNS